MWKLVIAFLVTLVLTIAAPSLCFARPGTNTTGHGCASPTPPAISGNPVPAPATSGIIDINEVLLNPHSTWNCSENGTYFTTTDSWVELYNTQNVPYNLYAAHAVLDSGPSTNAYYFPLDASIAAHGYLVLFPRTNSRFVTTETSTLRLVINSVSVDQITIPALGPDQSYARTTDGASSREISTTPTIDASNTSLQPTPSATPTIPPPTPTSTSTRGRSTGSESTGTSSGTTNTSNSSLNPKTLVNGTQPQWGNMQLPTVISSTPVITFSPTTLSSSPQASTTGLDLPRRIALTVMVIVLASALFWCWRGFRTPLNNKNFK